MHLNFSFNLAFLLLLLKLRSDVRVGVSHNEAESSWTVLTVLETSS